jgi:hypothetical protein
MTFQDKIGIDTGARLGSTYVDQGVRYGARLYQLNLIAAPFGIPQERKSTSNER